MMRADIVTVYHNDAYSDLHDQLFAAIREHEPAGGLRLIGVDNRTVNRGFAAGCNYGALSPEADAPMIGFLNPDVVVEGEFVRPAAAALGGSTVITGCRYAKPAAELKIWGVRDWVCGAAMFVDRAWFSSVGGFDTQFVWSWEETDLIRQAESQGLHCRSIALPLHHAEPTYNSPADAAYKRFHFAQAERRFRSKWGRR